MAFTARSLQPFSIIIRINTSLLCSKNSLSGSFVYRFIKMATKSYNVDHDPSNKEFFMKLGNSTKAYLQYDSLNDGTVDLYHTLVPTSHRGQGLAKHLAKAALDHFSSEGTKFKVTCTYLQKYVKDNPNEIYDRMMIVEDVTE